MSLQEQLRQLELKLDQMDCDDPKWDLLNAEANVIAEEIEKVREQCEARALISAAKRQLASRMIEAKQRIQAKAEANDSFREFSDWYTWAKSLYPIEENNDGYVVHSTAKNWSEDAPKYWVCASEAEAWEKIEQLIDWKILDRNRGSGSMESDLS